MSTEVAGSICNVTTYAPWFGFNVHIPPGQMKAVLENTDAVQVAMQLGRLDLVTIMLGWFALLISGFALLGYFEIRHKAAFVAREEAQKAAKEWLEREGPALLRAAAPFFADQIGPKGANEIAAKAGTGEAA